MKTRRIPLKKPGNSSQCMKILIRNQAPKDCTPEKRKGTCEGQNWKCFEVYYKKTKKKQKLLVMAITSGRNIRKERIEDRGMPEAGRGTIEDIESEVQSILRKCLQLSDSW